MCDLRRPLAVVQLTEETEEELERNTEAACLVLQTG